MNGRAYDLLPLLAEVAYPAGEEIPVLHQSDDPQLERIEADLEDAERALAERRYRDALDHLRGLRPALAALGRPRLELRVLLAESWARMYVGELERAVSLLGRARDLVEGQGFTDVDRAEVLYRLGCVRTKLSENAKAIELFTLALGLCERSGRSCDRLRAEILEWRSRCHRTAHDLDAAWTDAERALQLAQGVGDGETLAHVYLQASLAAERTGQWHLAKFYTEQAKELYDQVGDPVGVARMLNNLGGLLFLLGKPDEAVSTLKESFRLALEHGSDVDAAYAVSSLAQVNLRTGDALAAEQQARRAIDLLADRREHVDEVGNAHLVLGRALLDQGRLDEAADVFHEAERAFVTFGSISHQAAAWIAQGDLARRSGELERAADLYRRAAEALQDFHF